MKKFYLLMIILSLKELHAYVHKYGPAKAIHLKLHLLINEDSIKPSCHALYPFFEYLA